jgi:hypothetical protein
MRLFHLRRLGLVTLAAIGGYMLHRGRRDRARRAEPPRTVRNFLAMLAKRRIEVVAVRRGADRRGWIVEWEHGRSLYFPDEE